MWKVVRIGLYVLGALVIARMVAGGVTWLILKIVDDNGEELISYVDEETEEKLTQEEFMQRLQERRQG